MGAGQRGRERREEPRATKPSSLRKPDSGRQPAGCARLLAPRADPVARAIGPGLPPRCGLPLIREDLSAQNAPRVHGAPSAARRTLNGSRRTLVQAGASAHLDGSATTSRLRRTRARPDDRCSACPLAGPTGAGELPARIDLRSAAPSGTKPPHFARVPIPDRLTAGQQILTLLIVVRIHVRDPRIKHSIFRLLTRQQSPQECECQHGLTPTSTPTRAKRVVNCRSPSTRLG